MMFDRAVLFTDIHFGLRGNSRTHNEDCIRFIEFMIKYAKQNQIQTAIFLGDWTHTRSSINAITMRYSIDAFRLLNDNFEQVIVIVGNHDMPFRESRDITTNEFSELFPNIRLIREIEQIDNCVFAPYLLNTEHLDLIKLKGDYLFGHFELPTFLLTRGIEMPDHGGLNRTDLSSFKAVFTGHFHKRQNKGNVWYIGNCFPHDYGDSYDELNRGFADLVYGGDITFIPFRESPRYRHTNVTDFLENLEFQLGPNMYVKLANDVDLQLEDCVFLREVLMKSLDIRELTVIPYRQEPDDEYDESQEFESVDDVIERQLASVQSNALDPAFLVQLYRAL